MLPFKLLFECRINNKEVTYNNWVKAVIIFLWWDVLNIGIMITSEGCTKNGRKQLIHYKTNSKLKTTITHKVAKRKAENQCYWMWMWGCVTVC